MDDVPDSGVYLDDCIIQRRQLVVDADDRERRRCADVAQHGGGRQSDTPYFFDRGLYDPGAGGVGRYRDRRSSLSDSTILRCHQVR